MNSPGSFIKCSLPTSNTSSLTTSTIKPLPPIWTHSYTLSLHLILFLSLSLSLSLTRSVSIFFYLSLSRSLTKFFCLPPQWLLSLVCAKSNYFWWFAPIMPWLLGDEGCHGNDWWAWFEQKRLFFVFCDLLWSCFGCWAMGVAMAMTSEPSLCKNDCFLAICDSLWSSNGCSAIEVVTATTSESGQREKNDLFLKGDNHTGCIPHLQTFINPKMIWLDDTHT